MKLTHEMCIDALSKLDIDTLRNLVCITTELANAKRKHPRWPINKKNKDVLKKGKRYKFIIASAIVSEEAGELVRATLQYVEENGRYYEMHKEAIQTAAMALRFLTSSPEITIPKSK